MKKLEGNDNWKPKGYYPRATKLLEDYRQDVISFPELIDGIADAILEALKEEAIYHTPPTMKILFPPKEITCFRKGWFIFIEDKEEKGELSRSKGLT